MTTTRMFCVLLILLLACASGCRETRTWRPTMEQVTTQPADPDYSLDRYLRAMHSGRWTYLRCTSPCRENSEKAEYVRLQDDHRLTEGRLLEADLQPIEHFIGQQRTRVARQSVEEALKKLKGAGFVFFKLTDPLQPIPPALSWGEPDEATTEITYYDYRGRAQATGTLTRTAELEGFETVTCPAGTFENCLRVRVDLELRFPWVLHMTWSSYLWISREVGEVRRVHHLSGWFLIFWFSSGHEYELQEGAPEIDKDEAPAVLSPRWSTGAVLFDRVAPRPVIGGMIVDFDEGPAEDSTTQAAD